MRAFEFIVSFRLAGANCRTGAPKAHQDVTRRLSPRIAKQEASSHFLESVGSSFTSYAIHLQKDAGERVEDFLQFFDQRRSLFLREPDERAELVKQGVAVGIVI